MLINRLNKIYRIAKIKREREIERLGELRREAHNRSIDIEASEEKISQSLNYIDSLGGDLLTALQIRMASSRYIQGEQNNCESIKEELKQLELKIIHQKKKTVNKFRKEKLANKLVEREESMNKYEEQCRQQKYVDELFNVNRSKRLIR